MLTWIVQVTAPTGIWTRSVSLSRWAPVAGTLFRRTGRHRFGSASILRARSRRTYAANLAADFAKHRYEKRSRKGLHKGRLAIRIAAGRPHDPGALRKDEEGLAQVHLDRRKISGTKIDPDFCAPSRSKVPFNDRDSDPRKCYISKKLKATLLFFRLREKRNIKFRSCIAALDPVALNLTYIRNTLLVRLRDDFGITLIQFSIQFLVPRFQFCFARQWSTGSAQARNSGFVLFNFRKYSVNSNVLVRVLK